MAKNDESESDADRRALREALASVPPQAPRPRAQPSPELRVRAAKPAQTTPTTGTPPAGRDDDAIIKQITTLGSFLTTRMDAVDHRLDELADLLESLLSSLLDFLLANLPDADDAARHTNGDEPAPATGNQRSLPDPR